jgi:hypothetical protein
MIRHKSSTQWPDDREIGWRRVQSVSYTWRRREARVFQFSLKTGGYGLSVVWPQKYCDNFFVWVSKQSGMRFVSLRLKTDERIKTVWGHTSTSDGLLLVMPQNWWTSDDRWCTWHHHRGHVKMKWKTVGSMTPGAMQRKSDLNILFSCNFLSSPQGHFNFLLYL